ncbi:MAG: hypothetical protein BMS9Abin05_1001 [Rhodothermia bacterium]|nr:MAG: hypothetical protein BMS9Abin05_1001 [Rhodothermia bacterium]
MKLNGRIDRTKKPISMLGGSFRLEWVYGREVIKSQVYPISVGESVDMWSIYLQD